MDERKTDINILATSSWFPPPATTSTEHEYNPDYMRQLMGQVRNNHSFYARLRCAKLSCTSARKVCLMISDGVTDINVQFPSYRELSDDSVDTEMLELEFETLELLTNVIKGIHREASINRLELITSVCPKEAKGLISLIQEILAQAHYLNESYVQAESHALSSIFFSPDSASSWLCYTAASVRLRCDLDSALSDIDDRFTELAASSNLSVDQRQSLGKVTYNHLLTNKDMFFSHIVDRPFGKEELTYLAKKFLELTHKSVIAPATTEEKIWPAHCPISSTRKLNTQTENTSMSTDCQK